MIPMLRKFLGSLVLALALPIAAAAQSQATTGIIRGVVSDPAGAPVVGATVALRETQTGFQRQVTTNDRGVFVASLLPLGSYDVTARAVGYNEIKRTGIPLRVGETVDLALKVAAVELQAVVVEATQPVVDASKVETSTRLPNEAVAGLPNNGRNYLNLTLLTPNVALVQGPDGDELSIGGQKGIHNNVSVDGADFNNPFFGEQRGGQRPAFTFNLDAVQEIVVTAGGANAEFGRSSGGFVNVITKSGTNQLRGTAHYYGKTDALSGTPAAHPGNPSFQPDFRQNQFGFTLGGPLKHDRAFFFIAYDQQIYDEVKQKVQPAGVQFDSLNAWMATAYGGALAGDFGPIARTNDARALLAKFDFRLSDRHNLSLKYNYTWSEQQNGTFDVNTWARSSNGLEQDHSNAVNGSLASILSSSTSNELRFQFSREDRPRPYDGPRSAALGTNRVDPPALRPFPDVAIGPDFRFGMPFFLPIDYYDTRIQVLDNLSMSKGDHFFKIGGEYNRVNSVQTFIGFANSRYIFSSVNGFLNFVADSTYTDASGPVLLYLQQAGVGQNVRQSGTQEIPQTELAFYIQDSWKPNPRWTINYGLRWEAQMQPDPITPPATVFFAPFIGQTVTNSTGSYTFPSDGTIPSDKGMWQPRFGFAYDPQGDGRQVLRGNAGLFYARIPGLNLASSRSTNGSNGLTYFRNSALTGVLGPVPGFGNLLPDAVPQSSVFFPDVFVFDKNFKNPRTLNATLAYERQLGPDLGLSLSYTYAATDNLTRFINRNDAVFGNPWSAGLPPGGTNGITTLTVVESSAKSRYHGITVGLKRVLDPNFQFQVNYTLSFDKSDDDNERDPFTFRYARPDSLQREYNWSDRDQRHRVNAWALVKLPAGIYMNNRVSYYSAQPVSMSCGPRFANPFAPPAGQRAGSAADRVCGPLGSATTDSVLVRNTLRKDNAYFSWDVRFSRPFDIGRQGQVEAIVEVFNLTGNDNFRDPAYGSLLFNFDGTIRSGLGDPRQLQAGLRWAF
jgi:carboxypeptidase family protein